MMPRMKQTTIGSVKDSINENPMAARIMQEHSGSSHESEPGCTRMKKKDSFKLEFTQYIDFSLLTTSIYCGIIFL